jgi:hypothetical protein
MQGQNTNSEEQMTVPVAEVCFGSPSEGSFIFRLENEYSGIDEACNWVLEGSLSNSLVT